MSEAKILEHNPLRESDILREGFYGQSKPAVTGPQAAQAAPTQAIGTPAPVVAAPLVTELDNRPKPKAKPTHYKVVCISLYTQDIENLEEMVAELKRRGHTKANKSQLIRQALRQLDIDSLPPPQQ